MFVTANPAPVRGSVTPLPVLIYRGFLPTKYRFTRALKTAIPLRDRFSRECIRTRPT
jgi:hypothetical protein